MELDKARELKQSAHWTYVCDELDNRIGMLVNELVDCLPEDLNILQTQIKLLRSIKKLPDDIIDREEK